MKKTKPKEKKRFDYWENNKKFYLALAQVLFDLTSADLGVDDKELLIQETFSDINRFVKAFENLQAEYSRLTSELLYQIDEMEVVRASVLNSKLRTSKDKDDTLADDFGVRLAYNQALSDVKNLIERLG